jgi:tRNA A-37 threonylcarbamoyl transferase component Bud32
LPPRFPAEESRDTKIAAGQLRQQTVKPETTTHWQKISQLYHDALARDGSERAAFLEKACEGDAALRKEIESLLALGVEATEGLELPTLLLMANLLGDGLAPASHGSSTFMSENDDPKFREALHVISSKSHPLSDLSSEALRSLLSTMHLREYGAGKHLIRQGDPGEYLLLILSGTASARIRHPSKGTPVGVFGPGDVVGEISLLTNEARTADVISLTPVRSLLLSAADFHAVADRYPEVRMLLTSVVADRLGTATYDGLGGKDIHGYRIDRCVGRGGMGIVYEATRLATGEIVAVKMMNHRLLYQPGALRRFKREADALKSLHHNSIARLYECFGAYKTQFLVMEFCEGSTLNVLIPRGQPLAEKVVRNIIGQLAVALGYVHSRGLIHCDLKPSNVMVSRSGLVKLMDFGLVGFDPIRDYGRASNVSTTSRSFALVGTPHYMAPEQFARGAPDQRVDLYGLACLAYEMLSGRALFEASDLFGIIREKLRFVLPSPAEIGLGVTIEMHEFLARGLDHRPENRTIDLDRLAEWAGPVDLGSLGREL